MNEQKQTGTGALVASIIIVLLIVIGGIYSFKNRPLKNDPDQSDGQSQLLQQQQESTELTDIETDALNTNLEDIDMELEQIDSELDSTL